MIALGCDHGGFPLMKEVIAYLDANNIPYKKLRYILRRIRGLSRIWQTGCPCGSRRRM